MQLLGLAFTLTLLAANLCGLMLATGLYWRNRWFALLVGPLLGVTVIYAIECHHGLGRSLAWLGLASSLLSACLIVFSLITWEPRRLGRKWGILLMEWRAEFAPRGLVGCLGIFTLVFVYALAWRFSDPNLNASSEKIADLSFICSYYSGKTIPVPDAWLYPYLSTQYYSFQHYGAALMGRALLLPPGTAYNLAFCVLVALCGTAFSGVVFMLARKGWVRALVIAVFLIGGSGVTLIVHLTTRTVHPWTAMRFIGSAPLDKAPVGSWLWDYQEKFVLRTTARDVGRTLHVGGTALELPGEIFSYLVYLGDYHAPLSGYYLMGVCVMAMILFSRLRQARYAVIVGGTLTWTLLANTWVLPLQGLLVLGWIVASLGEWRRIVAAVAGGAAAVWLASWVYLSAFLSASEGFAAPLRVVPWTEHTPPLLFALFMLPTLALIVLGFASGDRNGRRLAMLWLTLLVWTEYFYADDVYSGIYDRFNSTLKWWPWVIAGTLMTLAPIVLERATRRWVRIAGVLFCAYPCFYIFDLWGPLIHPASGAVGKLDGTHYLRTDEFTRLMLERLTVERPGVAVERPDVKGAFTTYSAVPLLAGKAMWLGWYSHEQLWRGYEPDILWRYQQLVRVYNGDMPGSGKWLAAQGIDYVLWYRPDDSPETWVKVNATLGSSYIWTDILTIPEIGLRVGFWKRPGRRPR